MNKKQTQSFINARCNNSSSSKVLQIPVDRDLYEQVILIQNQLGLKKIAHAGRYILLQGFVSLEKDNNSLEHEILIELFKNIKQVNQKVEYLLTEHYCESYTQPQLSSVSSKVYREKIKDKIKNFNEKINQNVDDIIKNIPNK